MVTASGAVGLPRKRTSLLTFRAAAARKTVSLASQLLFCFFWESIPLSLAATEIGLESSTQNAPDYKHCLATKKRKKIQIEPLPEFG